ncbi:MAG: sulfite exporter TauE/SafE family protein [Syntrophorhabdaceae bacterium]|nr:sulfite exporter TauE/SafE family protein [Syntrophorhabdaceae bacterium]
MSAESFCKNQAKGLVIGLAGGTFGGLAGLGGGVIMIPLMAWLAGLSQHGAHGTSLLAIVFTGLIGAVTYFFHGSVDWPAALILAASAIATARLGALYAHSLPEKKLRKAFGWFLVFVSLLLVSKGLIMGSSYHIGPVVYYVVLFATGLFTGFLSGMMGVGGGGIMIPPLVILIGMPQHLAQGTSLLAMVPGSAMGAFTHYKLGNVAKQIALGLMAGAAIGGYFGATFAHLLPELYLKFLFSIVGLWMGIRYIRS